MDLHATKFSGRKNSQNKFAESHHILLMVNKSEAKLNHPIGFTLEFILLFPLNLNFELSKNSKSQIL